MMVAEHFGRDDEGHLRPGRCCEELASLRFDEEARNAFILGPVGVGKTFLATALGHIACRSKLSVHFERADKLFKRLKVARLDRPPRRELRKLIGIDLLIIDDFALQPMDATETTDFYELVVERHHRSSTVLTSNRDPSEWLASHGRSALGPVGRRPDEERRLRARHRGRVLPPSREADAQRDGLVSDLSTPRD